MVYLIVAAHPDDEVLGAGATIHNIIKNGNTVNVCLLSQWSPTRDDNLQDGIKESHKILGVHKSYVGDFGCMRFKDADHHEIVRFIESCIIDCQPHVVITHHPADVHVDHGITAECCLEAIKLPQRQISNVEPIRKVMFMEVPSSTDWNISTANGVFIPNMYYGVEDEDINAKIEAIGVYNNVLRRRPHPRSEQNIKAMSLVRGSQCGCMNAEAFQLVFGMEV